MSGLWAEVRISLVSAEIPSFPWRGQPLLQLDRVKSYGQKETCVLQTDTMVCHQILKQKCPHYL